MKTPAVALTLSLLLGSFSVGIFSANHADATSSPVTVTRNDTRFEISRYRSGRSGVSFGNDKHDSPSEYIFNEAGYVATITAGSEQYKVVYDNHGVVEDMQRVDYRSRALAGEGDNAKDSSESATMMRRRLGITCEDCEKAWDTVCGDGLMSLCDIEKSFGSVFGPLATESVETMCSTFLSACADTSAGDVCEDRCDGYDDDIGSSSDGDGSSGGDDDHDGDYGTGENKGSDDCAWVACGINAGHSVAVLPVTAWRLTYATMLSCALVNYSTCRRDHDLDM